ncbi:MAG: putative ATPase with chaperone activity, partial [Cocleimonas sp.]
MRTFHRHLENVSKLLSIWLAAIVYRTVCLLYLYELPEFDRKVLDVLREPLESGSVSISRAARQAQFPARFQLVA